LERALRVQHENRKPELKIESSSKLSPRDDVTVATRIIFVIAERDCYHPPARSVGSDPLVYVSQSLCSCTKHADWPGACSGWKETVVGMMRDRQNRLIALRVVPDSSSGPYHGGFVSRPRQSKANA